MLEELLENLGVKKEETRLYLTMLEKGPRTAGDLAKIQGWPRPNVYNYLQKLCRKGLTKQSERAGVKLFIPEPPQKILVLYKRKIAAFEQAKNKVEDIIPTLEKTAGNHFLKPRMFPFEGRDQIQSMLQDILLYKDIETYTFWPIRDMLRTATDDFLRYHNKERIKRNISLNSIWPPEQSVDLQHYPFMAAGPAFLREIRLAPDNIDSSMCYWIYGDKVMFISSSTEDFGFVIESRPMARMLRSHHKLLWDISSPLKGDTPAGASAFLEEIEEEL